MTGDDSDRGGRSRRDVLRTTAGAVAAGGLAANAGCLATLPPLGQRVNFGRVDAPAADPATYTEWVPDANDVDADTGFHNDQFLMYVTPGDLGADALGKAPVFPVSFVKSRVDYFGHGFESFEEALLVGPVVVLAGEVDVDLASETAVDSGYDAVGSYEGYDAYSRDDSPRAVLVDDDAIVWADGDRAVTDVRAAVDARDRRTRRLGEVDSDFADVTDAAGRSPWTWLFEDTKGHDNELGWTWSASNFEYDDSAAYYRQTYLFPDGETPQRGRVRDWLEQRDRPVGAETVDVEIDGRVVQVEIRMAAEKYRREIDSEPGDWPQVTWGVTRDGESVTMTHEAGDSIPKPWLTLTYYPTEDDEDDTVADAFESVGERFEPGESITVDLSTLPGGARTLSLAVSPGPEEDSTSTLLSVPVEHDEDA
jgi:hypothetical protein